MFLAQVLSGDGSCRQAVDGVAVERACRSAARIPRRTAQHGDVRPMSSRPCRADHKAIGADNRLREAPAVGRYR